MTTILDGKKLRDKIIKDLRQKTDKMPTKPTLAVVLVGNDSASEIYVENKKKFAELAGINSIIIRYSDEITEDELIKKIDELNNDESITAILVQLPLPEHISKMKVINAISPLKDVDGFTQYNFGKLLSGERPYVYPCTPKGILLLLDEYNINLEGKNVVIVGRSNIVGKPLALMMMERNATVTVCHSKTKNLGNIIKTADIVVSAVGENIIEEKYLNCGVIVVDVGIFKDSSGKLRGDVDFENASKLASYITPVPGGVGPMTIASLMINTLELFNHQLS